MGIEKVIVVVERCLLLLDGGGMCGVGEGNKYRDVILVGGFFVVCYNFNLFLGYLFVFV